MAIMMGAFALAVSMLISGAFNTISNEFMDKVNSKGVGVRPSTFWAYEDQLEHPLAPGTYSPFNHPFVQAWFMFIGEGICLLVFFVNHRRTLRSDPSRAYVNRHGKRAIFCYAATACCDMTATSLMYAGLVLSSASIYQMLRGAIVIFTAVLSVVWLRKKLYIFHWVSIALVVIGVCIVGAQSILASQSTEGGSAGLILGMILILAAQAVQSVQVVAQEKFIRKYNTPDLLLVGLEGFFGSTILGMLLIPMYFVKIEGYAIENAIDAFVQITNSPSELSTGHASWHLPVGNALVVAIIGNICSIAFFNVFGIKITTVMSGSNRMVLDSMRTFLVWGASLFFAWEQFHALQLVGFMIMMTGTFMYNEVIRIPQLFEYPQAANLDVVINAEHIISLPLKDEQPMPGNTGGA